MSEVRGKEVAQLQVLVGGAARIQVDHPATLDLAPGTYRLYTAGCKGCRDNSPAAQLDRIVTQAAGRATPTPPEQGEVDEAERLWANALHGDRDEWLAEVRALLARVAPQGETVVFEPEECLMCGVEETVLGPHQTLCAPCLIKTLHPDSPIPPTREVEVATPPAADTGEDVKALVERVRWVNGELDPDAPIVSRGTGYSCLSLTHGDIEALCVAALAAPAPREVSEAMVRAAYLEGYEDAESDPYNLSKERYAEGWEASNARAALSAETGTTK